MTSMSTITCYAPAPSRPAPSTITGRATVFLGVPALLAGGLAFWDPARRGGPPLCPVHFLTGRSCPGCGLTRSLGSLLNGRLHESIVLYPLMPFLALEVVVVSVAYVILGRRLDEVIPVWLTTTVLTLSATALIVTWVIRTATGQIAVLG